MLDIITLAMSCGVQNELETVKKQTNGATANQPDTEASNSAMANIADSVSSVVDSVESAVGSVVGSFADVTAPVTTDMFIGSSSSSTSNEQVAKKLIENA